MSATRKCRRDRPDRTITGVGGQCKARIISSYPTHTQNFLPQHIDGVPLAATVSAGVRFRDAWILTRPMSPAGHLFRTAEWRLPYLFDACLQVAAGYAL